jgi:hypothetical protein
MFTLCTGRQTNGTQVSITNATVMQVTGNFTDAGRGEQKVLTQADLTLARSNLTHI